MTSSKKNKEIAVTVIGAGLAGTEAVYQLIRRQIPVRLIEMRPKVQTGAHTSDQFAELVCSNSVGSNLPDRASGLLKEEMRLLGSYFMDVAYKYRVPAGNALAVDRGAFSREITRYLRTHTLIDFVNEEALELPEDGLVIVATGPLTSPALLESLQKRLGKKKLEFYDAVAPLVAADTIDREVAFKGNRYGEPGNGDYLNCPLNKDQYLEFVKALLEAERIDLSDMEKNARKKFFSACQPVEIIAESGVDSLRFGPMKPVGFTDPRTGRRPYAVVQLRQDNLLASLYNMVGFQTNLKHPEQKRVFGMIPGLEKADFIRLGQMHRNSYINSPELLLPTLQLRADPRIFFAGQLCGVEGYTESAASGLLAGINAVRIINGKEPVVAPPATMLGGLINYITFAGHKEFHPMNANFGIFSGEDANAKGEVRKEQIIRQARREFREFFDQL
ncbi:MAG: methylenetetrahydrofolate--tRNA-(uracil(54)-C(5))-methyltransferase (FADH(2)-oxidizing) TrmFO [Candidatus Riflebacteria bacterium]|jgi:methylenetetrahydrofolate--tRNA-(uracil-5-)-methyltransferase|nr:methylenetetrahydrofolate--tRNA-(uracil(54)-C(5))-methyltransferase (FADH(2)-oxidizing) TrmFO [Candidatus Riflebacteria bacterium]